MPVQHGAKGREAGGSRRGVPALADIANTVGLKLHNYLGWRSKLLKSWRSLMRMRR